MVEALFGDAAPRFLDALALDNSKAFFDSHREEYRSEIRQPLEDLLGEAEAKYGPGRVMRPNRDVRFAKDKSPYRTEASMWAGEVGGVYLSLTARQLEVGGGLYEPTRDQLQRAREAIGSRPGAAAELSGVIRDLVEHGFELAGPSLKTAPHGFDRDHPHIELLRLKHYAGVLRLPTSASRDDVISAWSRVEPLIAWAERHVGPALSWP